MRGGHGHRPVPELRPDDPRHGDRERRNVKMDDVTIQGIAPSERHAVRGARDTAHGARKRLFFAIVFMFFDRAPCPVARVPLLCFVHLICYRGFFHYLAPCAVDRAPFLLLLQKSVLSASPKYRDILR